MNGAPLVSVLIPAYNVAEVLPRAVESVFAQSLADFELLVVDDASSDGTLEVARSLAVSDSRVRVVESDVNGGPGVARSLGLSAATGTWIAILDADDTFLPGRLADLYHVATENRLDAVADNLELIDAGSGQVSGSALPMRRDALEFFDAERFLRNSIPAGRINIGWTKPMVRRAFLQDNGISWRALRHAEDLVYSMEMLMAGARFAVTGAPGYRYTPRRGPVTGVASRHSKTQRSSEEQIRSIGEIEVRCSAKLTPNLKRRLSRMKDEVVVASHLLDARDSAADRNFISAGRSVAAALGSPRALASCLAARYGPNARRLS